MPGNLRLKDRIRLFALVIENIFSKNPKIKTRVIQNCQANFADSVCDFLYRSSKKTAPRIFVDFIGCRFKTVVRFTQMPLEVSAFPVKLP